MTRTKEYRGKKKIVLPSSLRIPDPSLLLRNPGLLINLPRSWLSLEQDHEEGWVPKNWCLQTVVLEKMLESLLENKEIKLVNSKGNQPWIFTGKTDAKAEAPILWPPDVKKQLIGKDPDAVKDWGWEEKGVTKDEMVGWHHWLNGYGFEQTLGDSGGWESLVCCSSLGHKESDMT